MEQDLQIIIKGVYEELATKIGNAVLYVIKHFDNELDFRRMHRVIITNDFARELKELSDKTASKNPISFTNEDYAVAIGKILTLPKENEYEILPVLNVNFVVGLIQEDTENNEEEIIFSSAIHLLHHEFCHIHDDNKKIDALKDFILRCSYIGKDKLIYPLAEVCWSEYYANKLSSSTANDVIISEMIKCFVDAIKRTKQEINSQILSYRYHADVERLLYVFQRHGEFLVKTAAYSLGYLDGLKRSLPEFSAEAMECLSGSYFESTWNSMQKALHNMLRIYPDGWKDINVYDELASSLESYYNEMGLILSTINNGQIYVKVPFRPETTP